jgi:hypothetical protein
MLEYVHEVRKNLESALRHIEDQAQPVLKKAEQAIFCINNSLKDIRQHINNHQFQSQGDEILFFKEIKPAVYSKLIYFVRIFNIESKRPDGSDKSQKKYLLNELNKLEDFFSENLEFYQYFRNKMTFLDDKFFVRGKIDLLVSVDPFIYDADPGFSTGFDYKVAQIMANNLISTYLNSEITLLLRKELIHSKQGTFPKGKFVWTAHKNSLVELIYAFKADRAINDGDFDINELAIYLETIFSVDLGDVYRTFLEIKGRNHQTKFLDSLKHALIDKMNKEFE